jgi:[acyl-carrier-protein] S-malonyltransferase
MIALVFPGQGAQGPAMFDGVKELAEFHRRYEVICDCTGTDVMREMERGKEQLLNENVFSSLMTILVSTLSLDLYESGDTEQPKWLAGYSVGQWTAMYAAKIIDFEQLVTMVTERARFMDECVTHEPSAMCAVIGVSASALNTLLEELRADGHRVFISIYNCCGQCSIAGTLSAIQLAEEKIRALRPKKILRLPVGGGWHCPILHEAEKQFEEFLCHVEFRSPQRSIIDNVTGDWLPTDDTRLRKALARHISHPVRWEKGMRRLVDGGCTEIVDMGFGNNLTKIGLFIDRQVRWRAFCN